MTENLTTERKRHTISLLLAGVGIVLFWRGIWELSQQVFSTEVSLVIGLAMLIAAAIVERRQVFRFIH